MSQSNIAVAFPAAVRPQPDPIVHRLAQSNVTVLIDGETGSGKTHLARRIHEASPRAQGRLLVVNCAAIPVTLLESELFGHERGAFTGAVAAQAGAFEAAGDGTLLLDEIGELPLECQAKLLRALEERAFERVGSRRTQKILARILVATNRDLERMVAEGTFRKDLYFRISAVRLAVPPLRERGGREIQRVAEQLLSEISRGAARAIDGFSPAALEAIRAYTWPGNIRELRNVLERAVALGEGARIGLDDLPVALQSTIEPIEEREGEPLPAGGGGAHEGARDAPYFAARDEALARFEREYLVALLRTHRGRVAAAARASGLSRVYLYRLLRKYGLQPGSE